MDPLDITSATLAEPRYKRAAADDLSWTDPVPVGLTKREYVATAMLAALIQSPGAITAHRWPFHSLRCRLSQITGWKWMLGYTEIWHDVESESKTAVVYADALLRNCRDEAKRPAGEFYIPGSKP